MESFNICREPINTRAKATRSQGEDHPGIEAGVYYVPIKQAASFSFGVLKVVSQELARPWKEFSLLSLLRTKLVRF